MKKKLFETSGVRITRDTINPFDFKKSIPIPKIISPKVNKVINRISDVEGLDKAYKSDANIYIYIYISHLVVILYILVERST
jgi:hypothetical protein